MSSLPSLPRFPSSLSLSRPVPLIITLLTVTLPPSLYWLYADYHAWLALGPGGLRYNLRGYAYQNYLRMWLSRDTKSTERYAQAIASGESPKAFLDRLPKRDGRAPKVGLWAAPHRQLDMLCGEEIKEAMQSHIDALAADFPTHLSLATSMYERRGTALYVSPPPPSSTTTTDPTSPSSSPAKREIAHMHPSDGSSHVIVSAADAKTIIDAGWGERHGLSGRRLIPAGYLLLYAPRDQGELRAWKGCVRAAVGWGGGGEGWGVEVSAVEC